MATAASCLQSCRPSACPPWLQSALLDIEHRVRSLALSLADDDAAAAAGDSFADRAENYYQKRPQLLSLLHDLHNRYLYLADRYSQSLLKPSAFKLAALHHHHHSDTDDDFSVSSDAESSLSFQLPNADRPDLRPALDLIVAELVSSSVERNLLLDHAIESDRFRSESARKIELQRSLLEVLESERMVLAAENARLGFRAAAAEEEGRGMAAEVGFMRKKAAEMARCVVRMRDDHRVCMLGRRIEGLQAQIYGLEKRNREWFEVMVRREKEEGEVRAEVEKLREENRRLREEVERRRRGRWWGRVWGGARGDGGGKGGCFLEPSCFCL